METIRVFYCHSGSQSVHRKAFVDGCCECEQSECHGADCEQRPLIVSAGLQSDLSGTVSDSRTNTSCYCCSCQIKKNNKTEPSGQQRHLSPDVNVPLQPAVLSRETLKMVVRFFLPNIFSLRINYRRWFYLVTKQLTSACVCPQFPQSPKITCYINKKAHVALRSIIENKTHAHSHKHTHAFSMSGNAGSVNVGRAEVWKKEQPSWLCP